MSHPPKESSPMMIQHRVKDILTFIPFAEGEPHGMAYLSGLYSSFGKKKKIFKDMKAIWGLLQSTEGQKTKFPSFR